MGNRVRKRILVVDDEDFVRRLVARRLQNEGYDCAMAADGEKAWAMVQQSDFALIVTDIMMPGMSGLDLLERVHKAHPDTAVVMVTGVDDRPTAIHSLQLGAYGYIIKPFESNELSINVAGALERRRLAMESRQHEQRLEQKVHERTREVRATQEEITLRLVAAAEHRDEETGAHVRRMGLYAAVIAAELGWPESAVEDIRLAAPMHDIGKIGIPDAVLRKPGRLTPPEFEVIKQHTVIGARILSGAQSPLLRMARDITLSHQEKWDGGGYPAALAGCAIPECARIVAVADVYDALTHDRVYRPAISEAQSLAIMQEARGTHFDPRIFDAFTAALPRMRVIREEVAESEAVVRSDGNAQAV